MFRHRELFEWQISGDRLLYFVSVGVCNFSLIFSFNCGKKASAKKSTSLDVQAVQTNFGGVYPEDGLLKFNTKVSQPEGTFHCINLFLLRQVLG